MSEINALEALYESQQILGLEGIVKGWPLGDYVTKKEQAIEFITQHEMIVKSTKDNEQFKEEVFQMLEHPSFAVGMRCITNTVLDMIVYMDAFETAAFSGTITKASRRCLTSIASRYIRCLKQWFEQEPPQTIPMGKNFELVENMIRQHVSIQPVGQSNKYDIAAIFPHVTRDIPTSMKKRGEVMKRGDEYDGIRTTLFIIYQMSVVAYSSDVSTDIDQFWEACQKESTSEKEGPIKSTKFQALVYNMLFLSVGFQSERGGKDYDNITQSYGNLVNMTEKFTQTSDLQKMLYLWSTLCIHVVAADVMNIFNNVYKTCSDSRTEFEDSDGQELLNAVNNLYQVGQRFCPGEWAPKFVPAEYMKKTRSLEILWFLLISKTEHEQKKKRRDKKENTDAFVDRPILHLRRIVEEIRNLKNRLTEMEKDMGMTESKDDQQLQLLRSLLHKPK